MKLTTPLPRIHLCTKHISRDSTQIVEIHIIMFSIFITTINHIHGTIIIQVFTTNQRVNKCVDVYYIIPNMLIIINKEVIAEVTSTQSSLLLSYSGSRAVAYLRDGGSRGTGPPRTSYKKKNLKFLHICRMRFM